MPELSLATVVLIAIVVLAVVTVAQGIRTVPQGEVWSVERFGAFTRLLQPGLNLIIPYVDRIGRRLNVQEVVLDIPEQAVITRDNATVATDGIVYYRVMDPAKAAYAVQDLALALTSLAMTNIRSVVGELDLDATLSGRDRINTTLLTVLDGATEPWGVKVSRVEIRKIEPPENLIRAMNLQMTAERERRATVARAEGEKQALVLQAEGRRDAAMRDAEARERLAQAEANATRMVAEAAAGSGGDALRYFVAEKYVKAFEALAANPASRLVVVPMESASLVGGIAQAMELLRMPGSGGSAVRPPAAPPPPGTLPPAPPSGPSPWTRG
ncbi:SPFH domain-containing protein [Falsiroseomonas oryzae]|uniref:SPFH domain-containing protein n=1 Tax=Falsiroseomonas oryzae TaxID=2766473 RepID=UPI0022EA499D|nr:SPFH domain-containing protein [Roseomonas sp. MO-31]